MPEKLRFSVFLFAAVGSVFLLGTAMNARASDGDAFPGPTCFQPNQAQAYILPDNDQLFFPLEPGTLSLAALLKDFPNAQKIRDDYYITKDEEGFRVAFDVRNGNVAQATFEPKRGDAKSTLKERCLFIREIQSKGWDDRYLVKNRYESVEKTVEEQRASNRPAVSGVSISEAEDFRSEDLTGFFAEPNAVLAVPDQHGDAEYLARFLRIAASPEVQWIGMELFPDTMASVLKDYMTENTDSAAFKGADQQMLSFFTEYWVYSGSGVDNPYYQALPQIKALGKTIYAMDADEFYSVHAHYQSQMDEGFFFDARNANWASQLPVSGRGIVYGGSEHFAVKGNIRFQDFYALRSSSRLFWLNR
jgi:hypothetical protein